MKLIGIQPLIDIISLSLQSSFISNEKNGVSLLLIAKPETAKTSSIFKFNNLDFVSYYDEITQKKLIDEFLPLVKQKQNRTLLIPDLINCIEKQKSTREQFLNIIKTGIDDTGVIRISTMHKQLYYYQLAEGLKFNLITAITVDNFRNIEKYLKNTGLLSRFIPFSYDYPIDKIKQIFNYIEGQEIINNNIIIHKIKTKDTSIPNTNLFKEFEIISSNIGLRYGGFGIRAQIGLQRLSKANAILNNRNNVNEDDIKKVIRLSNWINFNFNPL